MVPTTVVKEKKKAMNWLKRKKKAPPKINLLAIGIDIFYSMTIWVDAE